MLENSYAAQLASSVAECLPKNEEVMVGFLVRTYAWAMGSIPRMGVQKTVNR